MEFEMLLAIDNEIPASYAKEVLDLALEENEITLSEDEKAFIVDSLTDPPEIFWRINTTIMPDGDIRLHWTVDDMQTLEADLALDNDTDQSEML